MTRPLPRRGPVWLVAALLLGLTVPAGAAPPRLRITGRLVPAGGSPLPAGARIELHPASAGFEGEVRRMGGAAEPAPLASVPVRVDGVFELAAPGPGFYRVVAQAEGRLAMANELIPLMEDRELEPLALPPAGRLRVKAVAAGGEPLAGLTVAVVPSCCSDSEWEPVRRRGVSGADGRLELPRSPGEALDLAVLTPAFLGRGARQVRGDEITLTLRPSPLVRLEIRGPGGRPAAGALVRWRGWPVGVTGPRGRFALAVPGADGGPVSVGTAAGERAEILPERLASSAAGLVGVQLEAPQPTAGQVVDAATGEPIAGALAWTFLSRLNAPPAVASTDGRFQLLRPTEQRGPTWVWAAAPGYLDGFSSEPTAEGTRIPLVAGTALPGSVVDPQGRPVAGIRVVAWSLGVRRPPISHTLSPAEAWTRPDGSFRLNGLVAGDDHELIVRAEGYAPAVVAVPGGALPRSGRAAAPWRIVLSRGQTATGQVVDTAGHPMAGAEVLLAALTESRQPLTFRASSDRSGRFEITGLLPGRFDLVASHPGFAPARLAGIQVEAGARTSLGAVALAAGVDVEGRVTDSRGQPLPGARVSLHPATEGLSRNPPAYLADELVRQQVMTDAAGAFRLAGLRQGERYELRLYLPGYRLEGEVWILAAHGAVPPHIVLSRLHALAGRVVGPAGEPVAGARLSARRQEGRTEEHLGSAWSDGNGGFRMPIAAPGPFVLDVVAPGYQARRLPGLELAGGRDLEGLEVALERGLTLEGAVRDAAGKPVAGARVSARSHASGKEAAVTADTAGRYRIVDLPPGLHDVRARDADGGARRASEAIDLQTASTRLDLTLAGGGVEVSGRLTDEAGEPLAGVPLSLWAPGRMAVSTTSGADGSFRFRYVQGGLYQLFAQRTGLFVTFPAPAKVEVGDADLAGLEIRLGEGATVTGRLLGVAPADLAGIEVRVAPHGASGNSYHALGEVGAGGTYHVRGVHPGDWEVVATLDSARPVRRALRVEPGDSRVGQDLDLSGLALSGQVLVDGEPPASAVVRVIGPGGSADIAETAVAHDGRFRLVGLAPGASLLRVTTPFGVNAQNIELRSDLDLPLTLATGRLAGRVVSAAGEPVAGARVKLSSMELNAEGVAADEQGAFSIPRALAGSTELSVFVDRRVRLRSPVEVRPGAATFVELRLPAER